MVRDRAAARKVASEQAFHQINNNFAAIEFWLAILLESTCEGCWALHQKVAGAIGRNLAEARTSSTRLATRPPARATPR